MRKLFHNPWKAKEKWILTGADWTEQTGELVNPGRGWYQVYTFLAEAEPELQELAYCLDVRQTLALVLLDIGSCRDADMDQDCLMRIRRILRFFADNQKDIILRVSYDHQGRALEREPFAFGQVLRHMEQVGGLLAEFADAIFIYQGLLVGSWGEMHTSRFLSREKLGQLAELLYRSKAPGTYLAVRRPMYFRMLRRDMADGGMGLFDDGIFGSGTDLGTFGTYTREAAGWEEAWTREEELAFEEELCRRVPNGGEAVYGEDYTERLSGERMVDDLRRMHISYLNSGHDGRVLELWKKCRCGGQAPWAGRSLYDYIGAHMGYRFRVKEAGVTPAGGEGRGLCRVAIVIENSGFARLYQEAELYLEWTEDGGRFRKQRIACDLRELDSGCGQTVSCVIGGCESMLYLAARRRRDGAPIRFANVSDGAGRVVLGSLCRQAV